MPSRREFVETAIAGMTLSALAADAGAGAGAGAQGTDQPRPQNRRRILVLPNRTGMSQASFASRPPT
jgi:hypothetical protein